MRLEFAKLCRCGRLIPLLIVFPTPKRLTHWATHTRDCQLRHAGWLDAPDAGIAEYETWFEKPARGQL